MVANIIIFLFMLIIAMKLLFDLYYIAITKKFVREKNDLSITKNVEILLIIPVLREQNIIESTLDYFTNMKLTHINLHVCIAGTSREKDGKDSNYTSTGTVVERWIEDNKNNFGNCIKFSYVEVLEEKGDRASQLNYAVKQASKCGNSDLVGVYDADSLPDVFTLEEVASEYCKNPNTVFQQPVHFVTAANRMAKQKKNPVLVANALYQTTWTVIRELPRWRNHAHFCEKYSKKLYFRNDYLIGHGEFIPFLIYNKFIFPEKEVTDGIQLGYRVSMSGISIKPLHTLCVDDVPQEVKQLVGQHKRWFGGCNRLFSAYRWCKEHFGKASVFQMLDGYWSQLSWAYASLFALVAVILSLFKAINGNWLFFIIVMLEVLMYCYLIPYISNSLMPDKIRIRFIDWLCLPFAIALKGIGPNAYLMQKLLSVFVKKEIKYSKVER